MRKMEPSDAGLQHFAPQKHVVRDRQRRRQRQVLVHRFDPGVAGIHRRLEVQRLALELDFAFVGGDGTADRLDEGRLAGTVVADDSQDFTRVEVEIGIVESRDAAIALDQPACGEDGFLCH